MVLHLLDRPQPHITEFVAAPAPTVVAGDGGTWPSEARRGAGWAEFRVHRALYLASLTLQSAGSRLERLDSSSVGSPELRSVG